MRVITPRHKEVINIKTPVTWVGNKTSILPILYSVFPLENSRYVEPFGGSGAVLLGKPSPDSFEVYNDYNKNLVNLFQCIRGRPMALIKELGFFPLNSRDDFNEIKSFFKRESFADKFLDEELELNKVILPDPNAEEIIELYKSTATDYDVCRAAMFLKLLRYSYSSSGKSFACQPFSIRSLFRLIEDVSLRLSNVVIENQDFETLIKHYDRKETLFYCEPPYIKTEHFYSCGFGWEDHLRLRDTLLQIDGKFLLSYNDCEESRKLYKDCNIVAFERRHSMAQKYEPGKQFPELLISNYDLFEQYNAMPYQLNFFDSDKDNDINTFFKEKIINYGK